jgi:hypothetical protein
MLATILSARMCSPNYAEIVKLRPLRAELHQLNSRDDAFEDQPQPLPEDGKRMVVLNAESLSRSTTAW